MKLLYHLHVHLHCYNQRSTNASPDTHTFTLASLGPTAVNNVGKQSCLVHDFHTISKFDYHISLQHQLIVQCNNCILIFFLVINNHHHNIPGKPIDAAPLPNKCYKLLMITTITRCCKPVSIVTSYISFVVVEMMLNSKRKHPNRIISAVIVSPLSTSRRSLIVFRMFPLFLVSIPIIGVLEGKRFAACGLELKHDLDGVTSHF